MKLDKKTIGMLIGIAAIIVIGTGGFFLYQSSQPSAKKCWNAYVEAFEQGDYETMYTYLSDESKQETDKETFIAKYTNIFQGIQAENVKVETKDVVTSDKGKSAAYTQTLDSVAGKISFDQTMEIIKEDGTYHMNWSYANIFPEMSNGDGIKVSEMAAKRGMILDRNGIVIAEDGIVLQVGIVPGSKDATTVAQLAGALDISEDAINKALSASWVKDDLFVPIKTIANNDAKAASLKTIPGIQIQKSSGRVYPFGVIAGHVSGYVQGINAEELAQHQEEGYDQNSMIGKTGLESIYEKELHGINGISIQVVSNGKLGSIIAKQEVQDGKDIKTTLDMKVQQQVYEQLKQDEAAGVAMNSKTGEVLALVSMPSYDPNDFSLGLSTKSWDALNNDTKKPLLNRFVQTLCPGSTFKPITGAIGLDHQIITPDTDLGDAIDKKWQKDKSWGDYFVKTTKAYSGGATLKNALIYSDNTFFAKLALQIGKDTYSKGLQSIGFNEKLDFPFTISASSYGEDEDLSKDITLADTGYGQGKLLVSPLHLTAMYTTFVNEGSMRKPYLLYDEGKALTWKDQVFTKESANTIYQDLVATFDGFQEGGNPSRAGGKTGTAQVGGTNEIGWICAVRDDIAITLMVDHVENKGESSYIIPMMQQLMKDLS